MSVVADLSEEERFLVAILQDQSGIDPAELLWVDETSPDFVFRCWDFQYPWYRCQDKFQIDQAGRALGKSVGMTMRAWAFPFTNAGEEMLLTAPELIHLDPVTQAVERRITEVRLSREFLKTGNGNTGFTHRPFRAQFRNGARIVGRIPQKDGKGVKGMHPLKLEMDEGQDYPEPGWVELGETLKYANDRATWRTHGVSRGVRDRYYKQTQPESGWKVHRVTAMHRPDWGPEERAAKAELYGSRDHPDYRRNILGQHGDAQSALFVLSRLMQCFRGDTPVQTARGLRPICELSVGDRVLNASGTGTVLAVRESWRDRVIRVTDSDGRQYVCTPEHPFLTDRGWVHADLLQPGERLIRHGETVRTLWQSDPLEEGSQVLREVLLRDLAESDTSTEATTAQEQALRMVRGPLLQAGRHHPVLRRSVRGRVARGPAEDRAAAEAVRMVRRDVRAGQEHDEVLLCDLSSPLGQQHQAPQAEARAPSPERSFGWAPVPSVHALAAPDAPRSLLATAVLDLPPGGGGGRGVVVDRRGPSPDADSRGGGWEEPSPRSGSGRDSGPLADRTWVVRTEVLEPGDREFDRLSREDGGSGDAVKVYDLTVSGHPSFCVGPDALVVHNCVDQDASSTYNLTEYTHIRINDEKLRDLGVPIEALLEFPQSHKTYGRFWVGMDVGMTNHPSEILVFGETSRGRRDAEKVTLKCLTRVHLERISAPDQRAVMERVWEFYRPRAFSMDRTGLGLPIYSEIISGDNEAFAKTMRGYNFSEKIVVGYDQFGAEPGEWDEATGEPIMANVLEYSSDQLRLLVDERRLLLPWDVDMLREFQGQTYVITKSNTDSYGRKQFNKGKFHALDAARMAVLGYFQEYIDALKTVMLDEPIFDSFLPI